MTSPPLTNSAPASTAPPSAAAMTAATAYLATDAVTDFATYAAREAEKEAKRQADKDARKAARTEKRAQKAEKARAAKPTPAATVEDLVELVARHQELYNANRALTEAEEAELKSLTERLSASVKPRAAKARAAAPVAPDSGLGYSKAAQTRGKGTKKAQSA